MEILSLAWRTDLALRELSGSTVEQRGTSAVVRTPQSPAFWWGNFLLLRHAPLRRDIASWERVFTETFPEAGHRAFGIDDPSGDRSALEPFEDMGYRIEVSAVMTADTVRTPTGTIGGIDVRPLASDDDWEQRVRLGLDCEAELGSPGQEEFMRRKAESERSLTGTTSGAWLGAFEEDRLVGGLGVFRAGEALARFQAVETHPHHRRRGIATALVHAAGQHALDELGAKTLVIVADPDYVAFRIYQRAGFTRTETQLGVLKS